MATFTRYITDIEDSAWEACLEVAILNGLTKEQAAECDDGSHGCHNCPYCPEQYLTDEEN